MKLKEKKKVIGVGMCLLVLLAIMSVPALAVPGVINYQGYLTDAQGNPVNGNVAITFRIWNAHMAGMEVWSESHTAVAVSEGVFNVLLGSSVPVGVGILEGERYLGITVGTDAEMTPRIKVTSVAYAIRAGYAESVAAGSVTTSALSDTAVTEPKIASGAVSSSKLGTASVTSDKVASGAVSSEKIASSAVTGAKVAAGTLTASNLQDGTALAEILDNDGAGSGLDADMLDGKHASDFMPAGTDLWVNTTGDTITGRLGVSVSSFGSSWNEAIKGELSGMSPGAGVYGVAHSETAHGVHGASDGSSGTGVFGEVTSTSGRGVHGYASDSTGTNFGVRGKTNSPNGYGGYFEGRGYFSGNVGIGTTDPEEKLQVEGNIQIPSNSNIINADGRAVFHTGWNGVFGDYTVINSGYDWGSGEPLSVVAGSSGIFFTKGDPSGTPYAETLMKVDTSGNVGIGTTNPVKKLTVRGNLLVQSESTGVDVLELGEGLDYAEGFDVSGSRRFEFGSVLVIDPDNPGKLTLSNIAYDTKVAGIVAGAKGQGSGVRLGAGRFDCDVALAGRVYCNVDASNSEVSPGDLLTTSPTPGYAMKVGDYSRAQGAILGKAMQRLKRGQKGQILVLVTLQ